jgi:hypothetical protein
MIWLSGTRHRRRGDALSRAHIVAARRTSRVAPSTLELARIAGVWGLSRSLGERSDRAEVRRGDPFPRARGGTRRFQRAHQRLPLSEAEARSGEVDRSHVVSASSRMARVRSDPQLRTARGACASETLTGHVPPRRGARRPQRRPGRLCADGRDARDRRGAGADGEFGVAPVWG